MPRQKVKMSFIENKSKRKVTYKRRVESLMKKAKELSILCGAVVCSIVYSSFEAEPRVWTTAGGDTVSGVYDILHRYYKKKGTGKLWKVDNQVTLLREMINKVDGQIKKHQDINRGKFVTQVMLHCLDFNDNNNNLEELPLVNLIELDQEVDRQLYDVGKKSMELSVVQAPPPPPVAFPSWFINWIVESCGDHGGQPAPNL